jgi:hypothetical protein
MLPSPKPNYANIWTNPDSNPGRTYDASFRSPPPPESFPLQVAFHAPITSPQHHPSHCLR